MAELNGYRHEVKAMKGTLRGAEKETEQESVLALFELAENNTRKQEP